MSEGNLIENKKTQSAAEVIPPLSFYGPKFPKTPGLHRMKALMESLGNPQKQLHVIHVAGTNGKGSVTSYLASIAAAADAIVGIYTSPFLERFSERIRVWNGKEDIKAYLLDDSVGEIDDDSLARLSFQVRNCAELLTEKGMENPTEFELLTALAFLYFAEKQCDFVILETGLGGRLDSTNIVEKPLACVITALGYDHMSVLGDTISQIAKEKAGIIKDNVPVFLYNPADTDLLPEEALSAAREIERACLEKNAPVKIVSANQIITKTVSGQRQAFSLSFFAPDLEISLLGENQKMNAALAVQTAVQFFAPEAIKEGLAKMRLKGRFEILSQNPPVIMDGCHNPQGAKVFRENLDLYFGEIFHENPPVFVIGVMKDKDYKGILEVLFANISYSYKKIFCVTPDNPRALPAESLKEALFQQITKSFYAYHSDKNEIFYKNDKRMYNIQDKLVCASVKEAYKEALFLAEKEQVPVIYAGSFFLVGEVRTFYKRQVEGEI